MYVFDWALRFCSNTNPNEIVLAFKVLMLQTMKNAELQLIQNRNLLEHPQTILKAEELVPASERRTMG